MSQLRSVKIEYQDGTSLLITPGDIQAMLKAAEALTLLNEATRIAKQLSRFQSEEV